MKYLLYDNDWYFYTYTVGCYITFNVLIVFSLSLFFTVRLVATLRAAREQPISRHGGRQMDTKVTTMLVVLLTVFLVSYTPYVVSVVLNIFYRIGFDVIYIYFYFNIIFNILIPLNSAVNFFIYLAYLKEFRRKVCGRCSRRPPRDQQYELSWLLLIYSNIVPLILVYEYTTN